MDSVEELMAIYAVMFSSSSENDSEEEKCRPPTKKKRKYWVRPFYKERDESGAHSTIVERLKSLEDEKLFHNYMRMSATKIEELMLLVGADIKKISCIREPLSVNVRLAITLRYLATGESQRSLALSYKCSPTSVHRTIQETTAAITKSIRDLVFPKITEENFRNIAKGFHEKWNFPNCIGAIDGKHVIIEAPAKGGSEFFNYKKTHSIVLLAICDHDYNFISCDIGAAGRQSDGGIFRASNFGQRFYNKSLPIPEPCDVAEDLNNCPFVFVADDAFSLSENMMKPYSTNNLTQEQRVFNYRLSRARRTIENVFGILSTKWRIFRTTIKANVSTVESIIESSVCLHNWLRQDENSGYITPGLVDSDINGRTVFGSWRREQSLTCLERTQINQKKIREILTAHFVGSGVVEWQWDKI